MTTKTYPIMGTRFHPPADILCQTLPVRSRLLLIAEPSNPYDPNAIAIYVDLEKALENKKVLEALAKSGNNDWVNKSFHHMGYIPKDAAGWLKRKGFPNDTEVEAEFYYTFGSNVPHAKFEFDEKNDDA